MSEIQVNTGDLHNGSQNLKAAANEIGNVQNQVGSASANVGNAYDGQLRAAIEGIVGGSAQTGARLQNRAADLGNELFSRATGFESANELGRSALMASSLRYSDFPQNSLILGKLFLPSKLDVSKANYLLGLGGFGTGALFITYLLPMSTSDLEKNVGKNVDGKWEFGLLGKKKNLWPDRRGRPESNRKSLKLDRAIYKGEVDIWEKKDITTYGSVRKAWKSEIDMFESEAGFSVGLKEGKGASLGGYAKTTLASAEASGVMGDKNLGIGAEGRVAAGEIEAFAGLKDGSLGAKLGGKIVGAEATGGLNLAGKHLGVIGEASIGFQVGLEVGKKSKIYIGPFALGLSVGDALGD